MSEEPIVEIDGFCISLRDPAASPIGVGLSLRPSSGHMTTKNGFRNVTIKLSKEELLEYIDRLRNIIEMQ